MTRNYRYLERKPSIILYEPPKGLDIIPEIVVENHASENANYILANELQVPKVEDHNIGEDEGEEDKRLSKPLVVYIHGPFGAPASHIFRAQHAVLIGAGIGITPFASILQSIMHRYWKARQTCPKCDYEWTGDFSSSLLSLQKVDFFWINRDQKSFEWFVNLLSQLEIEQAEQGGAMEQFLDMHMYITSALQKNDMKAVGLQMALELLHKKSKKDLITGLKTRTNAGRPNWNKVFQELSEQNRGKITVFFCGSPQLGKILKIKCDEFGFDYMKENF